MRISNRYAKGLLFFPFRIDILKSESIRMLIAEQKYDGFACVIFLWCKVYGNEYFKIFTNREKRLFCDEHKFSIDQLESVLNTCFDEEIFDRAKYQTFSILTSKHIQETWKEVTKRRTFLEIVEEYLVIDLKDFKNQERIQLISKEGTILKHARDKDGKKITKDYQNKSIVTEGKTPKHKSKLNDFPDGYMMPIMSDEHYQDDVFTQDVLDFYGLGQMLQSTNRTLFSHFMTVLNNRGELDQFRDQFEGYKEYIGIEGVRYRISFHNFIGTQKNRFEDGRWADENWKQKVLAIKERKEKSAVNGYPHKNGSTKDSLSKAEQSISGHSNFITNFKSNE